MGNKKDLAKILIVTSMGILLLYIVGIFSMKIEIASNKLKVSEYDKYRLIIASLLTLLGVLIEWKELDKILSNKVYFRLSCFIISILLIIFPMIPLEIMLNLFKYKTNIYVSGYISTALSILGGILLVRSFRKYE